jgi:O-antigen/teichoic acid export membrane protein
MTWLAPFWPACVDAAARGDWQWVERTYQRVRKRSVAATLLVVLGLAVFGRPLIGLWAGAAVVPGTALLWVMCGYILVLVWCQVHSVILNALGRPHGQALYGVAAAGVNIALSLVLGRWLNEPGVCLATMIAAMIPAVLSFYELRWALRRAA